ncbi:MAG: cupin domain-containing protein, partial [Cytophagales bacterium]|nr:cupin domain-containing protein [Cytophaga sp.]
LEIYVLGETSLKETMEVETMASEYVEIQKEIERISIAFEAYAEAHAVDPNSTIKPFILAGIDYSERMKNGEPVSFPPNLNEASRIEDYVAWLNRADMFLPDDFNEIYAKIIGYTPKAITAIVWIKNGAPEEMHHHEYEKFLIVEGTCDIHIGGTLHQLTAGDYCRMPLNIPHHVRISSDNPCKLILQRETVEG